MTTGPYNYLFIFTAKTFSPYRSGSDCLIKLYLVYQEDAEPAYAELDQDHYKKMKEEKEEKRRTLGRPSEKRRSEPAEPQEHTYAVIIRTTLSTTNKIGHGPLNFVFDIFLGGHYIEPASIIFNFVSRKLFSGSSRCWD